MLNCYSGSFVSQKHDNHIRSSRLSLHPANTIEMMKKRMELPTYPVQMGSATRQAARKLVRLVRQDGLGKACGVLWASIAHLRWRWSDSRFDRRHGVRTSDYILASDLDVQREKTRLSSEYEPSPERATRFILDHLTVDFTGFTFIDLGSGMGRVLLIASDYPFSQVIGVEFSPSLHEIACSNIARYQGKSRQCFNTVSICGQAEQFEIPAVPCVIYLFDPFRKEILEKVVANLERSYRSHPRAIVVVYYAPVHREVFDHAAFLEGLGTMALPRDRGAQRQYTVALYKTVA